MGFFGVASQQKLPMRSIYKNILPYVDRLFKHIPWKRMYHGVPNPPSAPLSQEGMPSHAAEPAADHHSVDVEATQGRQLTVSC